VRRGEAGEAGEMETRLDEIEAGVEEAELA
jgi:hypothetical protein